MGSEDRPGAGGTGGAVGKGNLGEKTGSSCNRAAVTTGEGVRAEKGAGVQGSRPCTLARLGHWRRGEVAGWGGSLGLESSGRRKSELRKALGSKGQLLRAWLGECGVGGKRGVQGAEGESEPP